MGKGLVRTLAAGRLDVIGDVYGELDALEALLRELDYRADGSHPDGRTLVFVGDLCDRGPDSVAVIRRVQTLIEAGRAQCVLGNHELNLLREDRKEGNGWYFAEGPHEDRDNGKFSQCRTANAHERDDILAFLRTLPLVLERADLLVVHACPDPASIAAAHAADDADALSLYQSAEQALEARIAALPEQTRAEEARYRLFAKDRQAIPEPLPQFAAKEALYQNGNPVRVLTSGMEELATAPFFTGGKWRLLSRCRWWDTYDDPRAVIFGHYWRTPQGMAQAEHKGADSLFGSTPDSAWLGPQRTAFCVDHCVGIRHVERARGATGRFDGRLSALRWPERELVMDDGRRVQANACPEGS